MPSRSLFIKNCAKQVILFSGEYIYITNIYNSIRKLINNAGMV